MASNNTIWYKKVLGNELIHCEALSNDNLSGCEKNLVPVDEIFENVTAKYGNGQKLVIGLYFLPVESAADECTNYLIQLYHLINYKNGKSPNSNRYGSELERRECDTFLEVVQIFLRKSVNWLDRCTVDESKVYGQLKDLPWYAVSVRDRDRVIKLTRRYQIKSLTPSLILLDGQTGEIITNHGRERLLEDPMGMNFPWKPRTLHMILRNVALTPGGKRDTTDVADFQTVKGSILGFYFSAHWCPPCRGFTPLLISTYNRLKSRGVDFEIIFVSSDRTAESHELYLSGMPWLAVPYCEEECRRELESLFRVQGIPTLVIVDTNESVITYEGRYEVTDDPEGELFPWRPRLVNILTPRQATKLQDTPSVVLFVEGDDSEMEFAETVLEPVAKDFFDGYDQNDERPLEFFIACDNDSSDNLREFIGIDDAVPLLTLINIPEGTWTVLEDGVEISEEVVKEFVAKFLNNELHMQSICSDQRSCGNT
ncbi:UNVERIFIED_CONTAM: hypothetical protein PYX00_009607 [Menopon gallinae]|uniref:Thioredoxin domain-containing protein n=1 Tax=Menopon gallinae TaxID=328185 RepID=A0AAW2HC92_9NEOP